MGGSVEESARAVKRQPPLRKTVEPHEFLELALSRQQLLRSDETECCVLLDRARGIEYAVPRKSLLQFTSAGAGRVP